MADSDPGSRSDLEALRRSGRGKILTLGLVVAAAAGAAVYAFSNPGGMGNPDSPARVMVVTRGQTVGQSITLRDVGFDAVEGTLAAWERKANDALPGLDRSGAAAVMKLADRLGYGYVVFEAPERVDFTGLDIEGGPPSFPDHVAYAVVSAGDLAFPHRVTVNPPPSPVLRDRGLVLLQGIFEQARLQRLLPDNEEPTVDELKLRDQLSVALDRLERIPRAEKLARDVSTGVERLLVHDERATPAPTAVGELFESGRAYPLRDGSILHIAREFSVVSNDGVRADLDLADSERLWVQAPGSDRRQPCETVSGGELDATESARWEVALDGSSILFRTLSEGLVLWGVEALDEGVCPLVRRGPVAGPLAGMADLGVPHGSSVARPGTIDGLGMVTVLTAGAEGREMLAMLEGSDVVGVTWLDERRLLARARPRMPGPDSLVLLDRDRPLDALLIPATAFDNAARLRDVAVIPGDGDELALVVSVDTDGRWLYLLRSELGLGMLFENPPEATVPGQKLSDATPPPDPDQGRPRVIPLDTNRLEIRPLTHQGTAYDPAVSPDGRWVAFALDGTDVDRPDANADPEIAMVSLEPGTAGIHVLTRNAVADRHPRFTADGERVVFRSRFELPRTNWVTTVARVATLEPGPRPPRKPTNPDTPDDDQ